MAANRRDTGGVHDVRRWLTTPPPSLTKRTSRLTLVRQISSAVLGAILLSADVADLAIPGSPNEVLRTLISAEPSLFRVFRNSHPESTSVRRAEALAEADGIRHVIVVFQPVGVRENRNRSLGEKFCHATIIRPEHRILEQKVREWMTDDVLYRKARNRGGSHC